MANPYYLVSFTEITIFRSWQEMNGLRAHVQSSDPLQLLVASSIKLKVAKLLQYLGKYWD